LLFDMLFVIIFDTKIMTKRILYTFLFPRVETRGYRNVVPAGLILAMHSFILGFAPDATS
jgi:hypothetical protein